MQRASLPRPGLLHSAGGLLLPSHIDFAAQGTENPPRPPNPPTQPQPAACFAGSHPRAGLWTRGRTAARARLLCVPGGLARFFFHTAAVRGGKGGR